MRTIFGSGEADVDPARDRVGDLTSREGVGWLAGEDGTCLGSVSSSFTLLGSSSSSGGGDSSLRGVDCRDEASLASAAGDVAEGEFVVVDTAEGRCVGECRWDVLGLYWCS